MKQYTENAMKFTMDGGIAYEYKDEEDVPEDAPNLKAIAGVQRFLPFPCLAMSRAPSCLHDLYKDAA